MGSANSHEIRQIVDEAVVALRSGQHQQQQQSFRHHRSPEVISLDEDDDDGILSGEGNNYVTYGTDDVGVWDPGYDSGSDDLVCGEGCCSDSGWSECCYETVECCVDGERERGCELAHEKCGVRTKKDKKCKECEKKRKCRKCRKKGPSFWSRCYPVKGRHDWGGDVVGVSRCPGEQDPKKWGFKIDNRPGRPMPGSMAARRVCRGTGSCGDLRPSPAGTGRRHAVGHRAAPRHCEEVLGDADALQPRRGRRRTLLFDEFDAFPRGVSGSAGPDDDDDGYRYRERDRPAGRRGWRRRRRDGSVGGGGSFAMHGALGDDGHRSEFPGGDGGGDGDGESRRRTRSWERRSDLDERVGEIDDRSEGSSYANGERERMLVSRRGGDEGRRVVRFGRA